MSIRLIARRNPFASIETALRRMAAPSGRAQDAIGDAVREGVAENFDRQQAGSGAPWAALAPRTVAERAALGYGPTPILERTGLFRRSHTVRGAAGHVQRLAQQGDGWTLAIGSSDERDDELQRGRRTPPFMPARPVNELSGEARARVAQTLDRVLDGIMQQESER